MSDTTAAKPAAMNLYQKLAAITGEIGVIKKGGTNKEQGYAFIEYAAVAGELRTLFAKYGVVIVPRMAQATKQQRTEVTSKYGAKGAYALIDFTFTVINADAPEDKFTVQWTGEAIDYGDKAANKAATGALKYYLMRQFNISEKGDDPDAVSHELVGGSAKEPAQRSVAAPANERPTDEQFEQIIALGEELKYSPAALEARMKLIKNGVEANAFINKLTLEIKKAEGEKL